MPELERRFAKGDVVKVVNPEAASYGDTGTVVEHILGHSYGDPYHYWVRVGSDFADIVPYKDEELEIAND